MSAELVNPMGPYTVQNWLDETPAPDGSKRELILGRIRVSPGSGGPHQFIGDELCGLFKSALRLAGRRGFYPITAVNANLSTARRTAVITDVVILNTRPVHTVFVPQQIELIAEIWSPGNRNEERSEKFDGGRWAVTQVGFEVGAERRIALIPDVVVTNCWPSHDYPVPEQVDLVIEVWSPEDTAEDRDYRRRTYASVGEYREQITVSTGTEATITAAPAAVIVDPAQLVPLAND